jgi:hypothetical protein
MIHSLSTGDTTNGLSTAYSPLGGVVGSSEKKVRHPLINIKTEMRASMRQCIVRWQKIELGANMTTDKKAGECGEVRESGQSQIYPVSTLKFEQQTGLIWEIGRCFSFAATRSLTADTDL